MAEGYNPCYTMARMPSSPRAHRAAAFALAVSVCLLCAPQPSPATDIDSPAFTNFKVRKCKGAEYVSSDGNPTVYTSNVDFTIQSTSQDGLMANAGQSSKVTMPPNDEFTGNQGLWHCDESASWCADSVASRTMWGNSEAYWSNACCDVGQNGGWMYASQPGSRTNFGLARAFSNYSYTTNCNDVDGIACGGTLYVHPYNYISGVDPVFEQNSFSVEAWVYWQGWPGEYLNRTGNYEQPILISCDARADNRCMLLAFKWLGSRWSIYMDFYNHATYGKTNLGVGWHHLVFTYDRTSNAQHVYVDGNIDEDTGMPTGSAKAGFLTTSLPATTRIGNGLSLWNSSSGVSQDSPVFYGYIDEMRIVNRVLTAQEVAAHYCGQGNINGDGTYTCGAGANPNNYAMNATTFTINYTTWPYVTADASFFVEDVNEDITNYSVSVTIDQLGANFPAPVPVVSSQADDWISWTWYDGDVCENTSGTNANTTYDINRSWSTLLDDQANAWYTPGGLGPNKAHGINLTATYTDNGGSGALVGPSPSSLWSYATTYAAVPGRLDLGSILSGTSLNLTVTATTRNGNPDGTGGTNNTEFSIWGSENGGAYTSMAGFNTSTTRAISALQKGSNYNFEAQARNVNLITTAVGATSTGTVITQPNLPTNLVGQPWWGAPDNCGKNNIRWTWNGVNFGSGAGAYDLHNGVSYIIQNLGATSHVQNVPGGGTVQAKIQAKDTGVGYKLNYLSGFSVLSSASTSDPVIPSVGGLAGTAHTSSAILWNWTDLAGTALCSPSAYRVYAATKPYVVGQYLAEVTAPTWTQSGLGINTTFSVFITARDAYDATEASLSPPATAFTQCTPPTSITRPTISTGSLTVGWSANGNPDYTRFELAASMDDFATAFSTPITAGDNFTAYSRGFGGLSNATTYYYRVWSVNGRAGAPWGGDFYSSYVSTAIPTLPPAPSLSGTVLGQTSINWTWPAVNTATSYRFLPDCNPANAVNLPPATLNYTQLTLVANTEHCGMLQVRNNSGAGLWSSATVYTLASAPSGLQVTAVTTNTFTVAWTNNNTGPTTFEVTWTGLPGFYETGFTGNVSTDTVLGTSYRNPASMPLIPATTYQIRVRAVGQAGVYTAFDGPVSTRTNNSASFSSTMTPVTPYTPPSDTVGVWHFDELIGTTTLDASTLLNHGQLTCTYGSCTSTPTYVTSRTGLGTAGSFPGAQNGYMRVPDAASLDTSGDLTIEAWVHPTDTNGQVSSAAVVAKGDGLQESFALDVTYPVSYPELQKWRFFVRPAGWATAYSVSSTQTLRRNAWTHLAAVYDDLGADSTLSIYIDGVLSNSVTATGLAARGVNAHQLTIGSRQSGSAAYDRSFQGYIDEVHIVTRAYSATDVLSAYRQAEPQTFSMPWPNDGTNITVLPNTFSSHTATILMSSSPTSAPIMVDLQHLSDGLASPPTLCGSTCTARYSLVPGSVVEIVAQVGGFVYGGALGSSITLSISYPDNDANTLVDDTFPPLTETALRIFTLNEQNMTWEGGYENDPSRFMPQYVDTVNKRVVAQVGHFSIYAMFGTSNINPNLTDVAVYPVPWKPGCGAGCRFESAGWQGVEGVKFDRLTESGKITILTLSGEKVKVLNYIASNNGAIVWDGTNTAGRTTASGVYFAYVEGSDGSKRIKKFAVER